MLSPKTLLMTQSIQLASKFGSNFSSSMKLCLLSSDVPGLSTGRTAERFVRLAFLLNASLYGVLKHNQVHSMRCPTGVTCVELADAGAVMARDGCSISMTHDWHSPLLDVHTRAWPWMSHVSDASAERPLTLLYRLGGSPFDVFDRKDMILYGIEYYVDKALELAAMHMADGVIFPSEWMRNWTCHHALFCDHSTSLVVPSDGSLIASNAAFAHIQEPHNTPPVRRRVRSFAFVGPLDDRHGFGEALMAVCGLDVTLHVFGQLSFLYTNCEGFGMRTTICFPPPPTLPLELELQGDGPATLSYTIRFRSAQSSIRPTRCSTRRILARRASGTMVKWPKTRSGAVCSARKRACSALRL